MRQTVQIDFGVGDAVHSQPQVINYPVLLTSPPVRLNAYPVEAAPPAALTAKFHSEPVHVRQWAAFVRRIGEPALANEFSRVPADLAEFLMPAAKAAATSAEYPVRWEPLGRWQQSSKI